MKKTICILLILFKTCALQADTPSMSTLGEVTARILLPTAGPIIAAGKGDIVGVTQWGYTILASAALHSIINPIVGEKKQDTSLQEAFNSSHTAFAFSGAGFIYRRYGWKLGLPAAGAAAYVAASRINADSEHAAQDVIIGAGIGIASSFLLTSRYAVRLDRSADYKAPKVNIEVPF